MAIEAIVGKPAADMIGGFNAAKSAFVAAETIARQPVYLIIYMAIRTQNGLVCPVQSKTGFGQMFEGRPLPAFGVVADFAIGGEPELFVIGIG